MPLLVSAYVAMGLMLHVIFLGVSVDPSSVLTWLCILAWPIVLLPFAAIWLIVASIMVTKKGMDESW